MAIFTDKYRWNAHVVVAWFALVIKEQKQVRNVCIPVLTKTKGQRLICISSFMLIIAHPLMQKDKCLQEVIDSCTDFLWGQAVQQQLQGLHTLCHQVDAAILHWAGQEAQQTWMPQGLQVLQEIKVYIFISRKKNITQLLEDPCIRTGFTAWVQKPWQA